jgi:putative ABC transport system permease protein
METLLQDLKHSLRMFRQSPGFTVTAVAALALGIGANTAIFSVVNTVLLKPLPYTEPGRIMSIMLTSPRGNGWVSSVPKFNVWKEQTRAFQDVSMFDGGGPGINLTSGDRPEQLKAMRASEAYFRLFGAPIALGRTFTAEEDRPRGGRFAVLSDGLWRRRFGADPKLLGGTILLGGEPFTVIGVIGAGFETTPPTDLWIPLQADPNSTDQAHYGRAAARLKPGVTIEQARQQMKIAADQFRAKYPRALGPQNGFGIQPMQDIMVQNVRQALWVLVAAVGFVLLIACANVASLLLARATGRQREIAIRAAIGAGRGRIIRQLLTESVLLAVTGGLLGLGLGSIGVRALLAINPGNIPRIGEAGAAVSLDWRVVAFTMGVAVFTGILFGLIPALNASRPDLGATLKESSSRSGTSLRQNKARALLVITELALAVVLLAGAALLIRTFQALRSVKPGFDAHNVLTMDMSLAGGRFDQTAPLALLVRQSVERIEAVPGVLAAATTCSLPLEPSFGLPITIEGRPLTDGPYHGGASWRSVSARYFEVFKIPVVRGRVFTDRDDVGAPGVVLINETMARQYWPKENPVGQLMTIGKGVGPNFDEPPREIIGVVSDVKDNGLNSESDPIMYVPVAQVTNGVTALNNHLTPLTWAIRTRGEPYALSASIQSAIQSVNRELPVAHVRSMERVVSESTARSDFNMTLLTVFAASAMLLAAIGIYGLMAYSVEQRMQEIGIRIALGAGPSEMRNMIVSQGMRLALIGVAIGLGGAFGLTRLMSTLLFGVKANDPFVFGTVAIALSVVALLATYIPARRATRVDPLTALRYE